MRNSGLETIADAAEPSTARRTPSTSPQVEREDPSSSEAPGIRSAPTASPNRWRPPLLILGPAAFVVGALGVYLATGRYVSEEDAYVQAVNVSISPQVTGQVITISARSNTPINKSELLFKLDPEPYRIALANAEAQLGIARDQVRNLIETYRSRLKQIDEAKATVAYSQTNYDRQQHLFDAGAVPRAILDAAIRDLQTEGQSGEPATGCCCGARAARGESRHANRPAAHGKTGRVGRRFGGTQSAAHLYRGAF
jgi:membrane fusion protein, multidrug efflux system